MKLAMPDEGPALELPAAAAAAAPAKAGPGPGEGTRMVGLAEAGLPTARRAWDARGVRGASFWLGRLWNVLRPLWAEADASRGAADWTAWAAVVAEARLDGGRGRRGTAEPRAGEPRVTPAVLGAGSAPWRAAGRRSTRKGA